MKKTLISLIVTFVIAVSSLGYIHALELPTGRQTLTENAFDKRYNRIPNDQKQAKVITLNQRIIQAKEAYKKDKEVVLFLTYIQSLAAELFVAAPGNTGNPEGTQDTETTDIKPTSPVTTTPQDFSTRYEGEKTLLGGTRNQILSKIELVATNEPIEINEVTISSSSDRDNHVETLYLYDEQGTLLGKRTPSGRTNEIRGIKYLLEQGSTNMYVVADLLPIGTTSRDARALSFSVGVSVDDARGYYSGAKISMRGLDRSDTITVSSIIIDQITLLDTYNGHVTESRLTNGENTLMIFSVSTAFGTNKQSSNNLDPELFLERLSVRVKDGTVDRSVAENLKIQRLDINAPALSGFIDDDTVVFATFDQANGLIENDDQAVYRLIADIDLDPTLNNNESVQVTLSNLNEGGVRYREITSPQVIKSLGLAETYRVSGEKIFE